MVGSWSPRLCLHLQEVQGVIEHMCKQVDEHVLLKNQVLVQFWNLALGNLRSPSVCAFISYTTFNLF